MKDSKAVKLIARAYDEGRSEGYRETVQEEQDQYLKGWNFAHEMLKEAQAQAKSQAYEAGYAQAQEEAHKIGYARGLAEGQARGSGSENSYNSGLEAGVKAERERALAYEPKLSVWFRPCGPGAQPSGINKLNAIKAIREAYGRAEGYGLRDVQALVENGQGARIPAGKDLPQSKAVTLYLCLQAAGFEPSLRN